MKGQHANEGVGKSHRANQWRNEACEVEALKFVLQEGENGNVSYLYLIAVHAIISKSDMVTINHRRGLRCS